MNLCPEKEELSAFVDGEVSENRLEEIDGHLKTCLQFEAGVNLMPYLREGKTDAELMEALSYGISQKPKAHQFDQKDNFEKREYRNMSQIGG